jgi:hypothetical protein
MCEKPIVNVSNYSGGYTGICGPCVACPGIYRTRVCSTARFRLSWLSWLRSSLFCRRYHPHRLGCASISLEICCTEAWRTLMSPTLRVGNPFRSRISAPSISLSYDKPWLEQQHPHTAYQRSHEDTRLATTRILS